MRDGRRLDPIPYLISIFRDHFCEWDEELRWQALDEYESFTYERGEPLNAYFARFDIARKKALREAELRKITI